ncbi:hypothetical protein MMC31_001075 [Peltigera leucophlebia]|nr:hypothetical protein [Peltigera leucophlebia]
MHINAILASFITVARLVSSAPADPTAIPAPASTSTSNASCVVPLVLFTTLNKPFTLSALAPGVIPWPVQLDQPSNTVETQLFISRTRIAQPLFRLTGGKLTTIGRGEGNWKNAFPAYFGFKILIFPPVPDPIFFGGQHDGYSGFQAGYRCDNDGKVYLELRAAQEQGFLVPSFSERAKISGKPVGYQGTDITIHLRINNQNS